MEPSPANQGGPQTRGRTIRWASSYDTVVGLLTLGQEEAIRRMTLEMAGVRAGEKVLDVGCGTGSLTVGAKVLVGPDGEVLGIDAAPEMVGVARRKAALLGVDVDFRVDLVEQLSLPDEHFDVVLSSLMLHHLPDDLKRRGVSEIYRVLKTGGRFLAVDFEPPTNPVFRGLAHVLLGHGMMQSNIREIRPMLTEAGFTEVEAGPTRYRVISFVRGKRE